MTDDVTKDDAGATPGAAATAAPRYAVGLTGGIGSGKSTVADMLGALGAAVIDTDRIAHALTAPGGAAMAAIATSFGEDFIDPAGALSRVKMRELVFTDPQARKRLEAILHPMIRIHTKRAADAARGDYLLYVVPLLVESNNWHSRVDRILVVDCPEPLQIARVMQRNAMREDQVRAIMATQASRAARLAAADDVVLNDGDVALLTPQVARLHAQYCALATERASLRPASPG